MRTQAVTTILNVDDHEAGRYARSRILRGAGFEVLEASTGAEALRLVSTKHPQLVLLDVNLPDINGYEVCRKIKATSGSRVLVLHVSATFVKGSDQKRGLEGGADGYLAEPVDHEVLIATVRAYLRIRLAETALRESEERFRLAFEDAPIGMALVDDSHTIFRANRALWEILDEGSGKTSNLKIEDLALPDEAEAVSSALEQLFAGEVDGFRIEHRYRKRNLDVIWLNLICRAIKSVDDTIAYGLVMLENVSERRRTEQEREQTLAAEQKARTDAEAANRAKDQFLAIVSHELRTPLGAILGWARILRAQPNDDPTTARGLEAIERNAVAQAQLIEDILDVSRIISGKFRLIAETVDLIPIVQAAVDSIKPALEAKRIRLETKLDSPPMRLNGDANRLQQMIWNLLSNAVKFSNKGGRVEVQLTPVDPDQVEIVVSDAGRGIAKSFLPHVFEPFRQADGSSTRAHGGLGLGLSIVKQLAELHGGSVEALSEGEGKGAAFKLRLPLVDRPAAEEPAGATTADPARKPPHPRSPLKLPRLLEGITVLVVDDEVDARELVAFILEAAGARVDLAASTAEALEILETSQPDLIVADIGMPVEDGYALLRRVRAMPGRDAASLPALALTAYARAEDRHQAFSAGFQSHVTKPVEPHDLVVMSAHLLKEARGKGAARSS